MKLLIFISLFGGLLLASCGSSSSQKNASTQEVNPADTIYLGDLREKFEGDSIFFKVVAPDLMLMDYQYFWAATESEAVEKGLTKEYYKRVKKEISETNEAIKKGFHDTKWPGRIEKIKDNPVFIIDGAHNEDGARSLTNALEKNFKGKKLTFLIGMLADKDIDSVLDLLMDKFEKVVTTTPDSDRAISCEELKAKIEKYGKEVVAIPKIEEAVQYVLNHAEKDEVIIAAGSLYMIGHIRSLVK